MGFEKKKMGPLNSGTKQVCANSFRLENWLTKSALIFSLHAIWILKIICIVKKKILCNYNVNETSTFFFLKAFFLSLLSITIIISL